jgi:hypothetical protein
MRFGRFQKMIVFMVALIASVGATGSARSDFMPAGASTFVGQFESFLANFPKWDMTHQDMPLIFLALTPEEQRPQALVMLWLLWMRDQQNTPNVASTGGGTVASLPPNNNPPPSGGSGPPTGGGHTSGNSPEPTSLALFGCGSLGLLAYRLVRSRGLRRG